MRELFQSWVMCACLCALAALVAACALAGLRFAGRSVLARLRPVALAALLPMAAYLTDFAGEKGTNMPRGVSLPVAALA